MFCVKNPSALNKPWILSKKGEENVVSIPVDVTRLLSNYHITAIEFLYHNYRKGMKGSILNEDPDMNYPLQISAFFRAVVGGPAVILVICNQETSCFWHYHLSKHADFDVVRITAKNSKDSHKTTKKLALLVTDSLKYCEDLVGHDFFSVVIENCDQFATKRIMKRLRGNFNVGLTARSFYTDPNQKIQWNMLDWANPGCVGKLNDFYNIDNDNFARFNDSYRFWWLRLTWRFCESFVRPTEQDVEVYKQDVETWAYENAVVIPRGEKKRKRKIKKPVVSDESHHDVMIDSSSKVEPCDDVITDSSSKLDVTPVPTEYVKLPSMDENPIVTSIIKNFEISPEAVLDLPYTQTKSFGSENSVILSFLNDEEKPSTSRSESEDFILNMI